jgi:ribosomal-protein-alanine N-acetyltransferase
MDRSVMPHPEDEAGGLTDVVLRPLTVEDIPAILSILRESPEASLWSEQSLLDLLAQGVAWAAEYDRVVKGVLFGRAAADEFEILNLAVAKDSRRQGIARRLVQAAMEQARAAGAARTYLEVRASNQGAIDFYQQLGFAACGCRPHYYRHPAEDAVLMSLQPAKFPTEVG